jgi:hypothetical protein
MHVPKGRGTDAGPACRAVVTAGAAAMACLRASLSGDGYSGSGSLPVGSKYRFSHFDHLRGAINSVG